MKLQTVRDRAREREPLHGVDAHALEGALTLTERERDEALAKYQFMLDRAANDKHDGYREVASRVNAAWEKLFNERNSLWRQEADRVGAVMELLEANGCDCDCDLDAESDVADCDRCLACRISWAIET